MEARLEVGYEEVVAEEEVGGEEARLEERRVEGGGEVGPSVSDRLTTELAVARDGGGASIGEHGELCNLFNFENREAGQL